MSIAFDCFCLIVLLVKPAAVVLLVLMGMGGCLWFILCSVVCIAAASCPLSNRAAILASAADAMTLRMQLLVAKMALLSVIDAVVVPAELLHLLLK